MGVRDHTLYEWRRGQTTKRASERRDKEVERWRVGAARRAAEKCLASLAAASMVEQCPMLALERFQPSRQT
jgi:hypothetical protein